MHFRILEYYGSENDPEKNLLWALFRWPSGISQQTFDQTLLLLSLSFSSNLSVLRLLIESLKFIFFQFMAPKLEHLGPCTSNGNDNAQTSDNSDVLPGILHDPYKRYHYTPSLYLGKVNFI